MTETPRRTARFWVPVTVVLLVAGALLTPQLIALRSVESSRKPERGAGPQNAGRPSAGSIALDLSDYSAVLSRHTHRVDGISFVDYAALTRDRHGLDRFVAQLERIDPEALDAASEYQQIALWINAYNALTLRLIIDNYPIQASLLRSLVFPSNSIRQIPGAWDDRAFVVAGSRVSLSDIEHQILRARFSEPLIHLALNCASLSCPSLRDEPYSPDKLREQLEDQARIYLLRHDSLEVAEQSTTVRVSAIFEWYAEDLTTEYGSGLLAGAYGPVDGPVLEFVARHGPPHVRTIVSESVADWNVEFQSYDWSLNDRQMEREYAGERRGR